MKAQSAMVRFQRYQIDQLRMKLEGLETMRAELISRKDQLDETLESERIRSNDSDIGRLAFPTFQKSVRDRQANLQRSADEISDQIAEARRELDAAFDAIRTAEGEGALQDDPLTGGMQQRSAV